MKSFSPKPWFAPQPVLIIGTYNNNSSLKFEYMATRP